MGFAIHRTSLCTVRTMAEIFSSQKAYMLVAMLKTVLWVMAISMPILMFIPETASSNLSCAVTDEAIIGGFLFGVGAAVNGGCAFSTLSHLASGDLWMLTTLLGFCLGVACLSVMGPIIEPCQTVPSLLLVVPKTAIFSAIVLLWLFIIWEIFRLWRSRAKEINWNQLFLSRNYRLSTGALVMGISGGALYALMIPGLTRMR
ncbi:MAG: YeeE/YedE thiosulfate transporter family protein [Desulfobacterales bacterium]